MARIVGGIATSHTPTLGFALDHQKQDDPVWKPIFEAYEPIKAWLAETRPDALVVIYNDHVTSFFFDHYSAFCLGVGESYEAADEGGGPRALPPLQGHSALARHIGSSLVAAEFDMSFFQNKPLDHGCFSPLSLMREPHQGWPAPIVPLQVGVLQFPIPTAARCYKLGKALRTAIESFPEDLAVAVVATGGLSHQVHGERAGFNNLEWDERFLDLFETDPEALARMTHAEFATLGGFEGSEVIMWLVMRGALSPSIRRRHRNIYLPSMTAIGTAVYDDLGEPMSATDAADARAEAGRQLAGVEDLAGTYPFDLARSVKAYRLNAFLHDLISPEARAAFLSDPEAAFEAAGLTDVERAMIRQRDFRALIQYGAIFFVLEKLAAVLGLSNLDVYAHMRGETLEAFQRTRNAAINYSVSGDS